MPVLYGDTVVIHSLITWQGGQPFDVYFGCEPNAANNGQYAWGKWNPYDADFGVKMQIVPTSLQRTNAPVRYGDMTPIRYGDTVALRGSACGFDRASLYVSIAGCDLGVAWVPDDSVGEKNTWIIDPPDPSDALVGSVVAYGAPFFLRSAYLNDTPNSLRMGNNCGPAADTNATVATVPPATDPKIAVDFRDRNGNVPAFPLPVPISPSTPSAPLVPPPAPAPSKGIPAWVWVLLALGVLAFLAALAVVFARNRAAQPRVATTLR